MADHDAPPPVPVTEAPDTQPVPVPDSIFVREPARVSAAIVNLLLAILTLLAVFGLEIDADQKTAIVGAVTSLIATVQLGAELLRSRVTPMARAQDAIELAYTAQPGIGDKPEL